jgi:hypothetical protein
MPIVNYTRGYPLDGSSLGQSKSTIRNNLDSTFDVFSVDHENQNSPDGYQQGVHKKSTYANLGADPTTVSGQMAVYSRAVTGGSALFSIRDGNAATKTQLTSAAFTAPQVSTNGYTWLPGGVIYQWAAYTVDHLGQPIQNGSIFLWPLLFPNNVFSAQMSAQKASTGAEGLWFAPTFPNVLGFQILTNSSVGQFTTLFISAVGN